MTTLALDIGATIGWARSDGGCGSWKPERSADHGMALALYHDWLDAMLAENVTLLAIERPFGSASFTHRLTMLFEGIAHMLAWTRDIPRTDRTADQVRKHLLGFPRIPKSEEPSKVKRDKIMDELISVAVRARGFAPPDEHAADACALLCLVDGIEPRQRAVAA